MSTAAGTDGRNPAWFGAVMATGATGIVTAANPTGLAGLETPSRVVGIALLGIAAVVFVALAVADFVLSDLHRHVVRYWDSPDRGPALATIPGAVNVLALGVVALFPDVAGHAAGWWSLLVLGCVATVAGVALTFGFFGRTFGNDALDVRDISGVWFVPETVLLLGSLLLSKLAREAPEEAQRSLTVVALLLLGAGSILFALTAALFFVRLVVVGPRRAAGPMWIMLSPLSVLCLALQYAAADTATLGGIWDASVRSTADFLASLLWGFAVWWIGPATVLTVRSGEGALSRSPGDWGFVFPVAALSLATVTLGAAWESGLIAVLGVLFSAVSLAAWAVVSYLSLSGLRRRSATAR